MANISRRGLQLIARFEGLRLRLYNDPAGHCTIGVGHLVHRGNCNGSEPAEFRAGISEERAYEILEADASRFVNAVDRLVTVPLNQNQFDALVSFTFNLGEGTLARSDLLRLLNSGNYSSVPVELKKFVWAGGVILPGLVKRRDAEAALFTEPMGPSYSARVCDGVPCVVDTGRGMVVWGVWPSGEVTHRWQNSPGGAWSEWAGMGKPGDQGGVGRPMVVVGRDGGMALFVRGADGQLHHRWQNSPGGPWSEWVSMGVRLLSDPCVVLNPNGGLSLFGRGEGDRPVHTWQHGPGEGYRWHESWVEMGGPMRGRPCVLVGRDGGMVLFARGVDDQLHHRWQNSEGGPWSDWAPLGGQLVSDPVVVRNPNGGLSVFARGHGDCPIHTWQHGPGEGFRWHESWVEMGGPMRGRPTVLVGRDGGMVLFARGVDDQLHHRWQNSEGGPWSDWAPLNGPCTDDPSAVLNPHGGISLFTRDHTGHIHHTWQHGPDQGHRWHDTWVTMGGPINNS